VAVTTVNGLEIAYDIIGGGAQTWAITPGGRFSKDYGGVRELAQGLAATGRRVLIWDRPNCGASSVSFTGPTESALQADTLAALIRQLDLGPAVIAGGSGGSRVSLLTVARNPDIATGLAMWWISGGVFGLMALGTYYCGGSIEAAWKYGMKRVVELPEWQEVLERNPANRDRFLAMDPRSSSRTWSGGWRPTHRRLRGRRSPTPPSPPRFRFRRSSSAAVPAIPRIRGRRPRRWRP
jgi:pimeloyl-ACP methyl ester carboxylesterase